MFSHESMTVLIGNISIQACYHKGYPLMTIFFSIRKSFPLEKDLPYMVFMYIHRYIHIHVLVCVFVCMCVCVRMRDVCMRVYVCGHVHVCVHPGMCVYSHVYVCVFMCTCYCHDYCLYCKQTNTNSAVLQ